MNTTFVVYLLLIIYLLLKCKLHFYPLTKCRKQEIMKHIEIPFLQFIIKEFCYHSNHHTSLIFDKLLIEQNKLQLKK